MKSKTPSEVRELLPESGFVTTEADVIALRRLRREVSNVSLNDLSIFNPPRFSSLSSRVKSTSEGWEPFELS